MTVMRVMVASPSLGGVQTLARGLEQESASRVFVAGHVTSLQLLASRALDLHADIVVLQLPWSEPSDPTGPSDAFPSQAPRGEQPHRVSELERAIRACPVPVVLFVYTETGRVDDGLVLRLIRAGAVDSLRGDDSDPFGSFQALRQKLARVVRRQGLPAAVDRLPRQVPSNDQRSFVARSLSTGHEYRGASDRTVVLPWNRVRQRPVHLVGIAASMGGVSALQAVLSRLDASFPAPIVVVIHMQERFVQPLVEQLGRACAIPIAVARDGEGLRAPGVFVAPAARHIEVGGDAVVHLTAGPPRWGCIPSADVLFQSLARSFPGRCVGIVLTGMGKDGAQGLLQMRRAGCVTAAQDESSSVVYGMPKAAVQQGAARYEVPLAHVADFLHHVAMGDQR